MSSVWLLALFALVTSPWWGRLAATLLADLQSAAEDALLPPEPARPRARLAPTLLPNGRVPVNRVLAFQGIERRVAARRRWQAGFGRRGL